MGIHARLALVGSQPGKQDLAQRGAVRGLTDADARLDADLRLAVNDLDVDDFRTIANRQRDRLSEPLGKILHGTSAYGEDVVLREIARAKSERAQSERVRIGVSLDELRVQEHLQMAQQRGLVLTGDRSQIGQRQSRTTRIECVQDLERAAQCCRAAAGRCWRHVCSPSVLLRMRRAARRVAKRCFTLARGLTTRITRGSTQLVMSLPSSISSERSR